MPRLASLSSKGLTGIGLVADIFEYVVTIVNTNAESSRADDDFAQRRFSFAANTSLIAVGAALEDITSGTTTNNGKVYVYGRQGQLLHTLTNPNAIAFGPPDGQSNDNFGNSVWLTDQYLIVLATGEDRSTDTFESNVGRLYLYDVNNLAANTPTSSAEYVGSLGSQGGGALFNNVIYAENPTSNVYTKISIPSFTSTTISTQLSRNTFSGNVAPGQTYVAVPVGGPSTQRSVEVYDRTTDTLVTTLTGPVGSSSSFAAGDSIVSQNSTLTAVGDIAAQPNGETGDLGGAVWLYNSATGAVVSRIDNPSTSAFSGRDNFGSRVAMNDKWLVIGAPGEDVNIGGFLRLGLVYVYKLSDLSLAYTIQTPTPGSSQTFGRYIQLQGDLLLISESIAERVHVYTLR